MPLSRISFAIAVLLPLSASAQSTPASPQQSTGSQTPSIALPPVTVTAQKEPADAMKLPVSVTAVLKDALDKAGVTQVSDAAVLAPNTVFTEFTARKLSNARFRGIGSSPNNPSITTYIDDVPQLNASSSSLEFLDITRVEFVRGPQSALFGRNALGGVVNIVSERPSLSGLTGGFFVPLGSNDLREVQGSIAGPLSKTVAAGVTIGHSQRDGFTVNDVTGHDLDSRDSTYGKGQLLWKPTAQWEARVLITAEQARDGDYALSDLGGLRANPYHTSRDFEGSTDRDVTATTVTAHYEGAKAAFSSTTGWVSWKTHDRTDLDYTPAPYITRDNLEKDRQITQEFRIASGTGAPLKLGSHTVKWQTGVFFFDQNYDQNAVNSFAAGLLSPQVPFPVSQTSPLAALDDSGVGIYGQGVITMHEKFDVTAGARFDHESKNANIQTTFSPAIFAPTTVNADRSFNDVSPQFSATYRLQPDRMLFVSVSKGFKAGGFNPAAPPGSESYGEENSWNVEGGVKLAAAGGRVTATASVFSIDWTDLQTNLPIPGAFGQFYVANVGGARSTGVEFELAARPRQDVEFFTALGTTHARFDDGSTSGGADVSSKKLPFTPDYNLTFGAQVTRTAGEANIFGRGEVVVVGAFQYDDPNTAEQGTYSLVNLRGGVRIKHIVIEAWVRNALDTFYVPVAFAYQPFAPSGFVGESGKPRTFGVRLGVGF